MTQMNPTSLAPGVMPERGMLGDPDSKYFGLSAEAVVKVAILTPLFVAVYWLVQIVLMVFLLRWWMRQERVFTPNEKKPNQAPEPTPGSVTPRATETKTE